MKPGKNVIIETPNLNYINLMPINCSYLFYFKRYGERAKELSSIFSDQPQTPLERAVFWTEYVIRHNGILNQRLGI